MIFKRHILGILTFTLLCTSNCNHLLAQSPCETSYTYNENELLDTRVDLQVEGKFLYIKGYIDSSFYKRLTKTLKKNPQIETIVFIFVPGSDDDDVNLKAAYLIRDRKLNTCVPKNGEIDSGGVDLFLSGVNRKIHPTARIGVHDWAGNDGKTGNSTPIDDSEHLSYLYYYEDMEIDKDFYWFTLKAGTPDEIHYMTRDEIKQFKLETSPIK
jgi:hypothetical protein